MQQFNTFRDTKQAEYDADITEELSKYAVKP